ncbi:RNA polymerase sigma factor [Anaeromicropila herbilytica]|uniref:Sigma-70 family RNA polymerase sigma factor n=1 Tax=Anaeromicropila herbilytica TaxID=2785025 RepID=A0A7R7EH27_9FIRM|nr:RNA polymerase sigma factor [Anaeromicropila herbilytica]BCN29095.1 hypothetical protein bsdtb5_03900 [Anaeromicropila herbilytica]
MNQKDANQVITEYVTKLYGFALKRTANLQDAEDLSQDIAEKLYQALLVKEIDDVNAFVWCVAHNTLVNYYRKKQKRNAVTCIDECSELIYPQSDFVEELSNQETLQNVQKEIAYLSNMQRKIIILYYYEGRKIDDIAEIISIPTGTVKWHLFEAKREMKKGMEKMRNVNELKFNPIKFTMMGFSGSIGTMGNVSDFLRSILSQNILYCVYHEAKNINEIADCLNVSPVYIENEIAFLYDYGFLTQKGNKYLANIVIDELNEDTYEIMELQDNMYSKAAKIISNELFDELMTSDILEQIQLYYPDKDKNFLAWGLVPFLLAWPNHNLEEKITFEEVTTIRKDGGQNIAYASLDIADGKSPKYYDSMGKWMGPLWNGLNNEDENILMWQINSEWSDRELYPSNYSDEITRDLRLLGRFVKKDLLSKDEYTYLAQKGYIKNIDGEFELEIIWLKDSKTKETLLNLSEQIRIRHMSKLESLKQEYCKKCINSKPKHVQKMVAFGLQHTFYSDGWFLLYSIKELLENGRLKLPKEEQRIALSTLIMPNQ